MVEKSVVKRVGNTISAGDRLCIETRTAISDVGRSCKDVALTTKNIADEYSAFSD